MLTLVRYFPLLAGYYVPYNDKVWHLVILLRRILNFLLAQRIHEDNLIQLKYIIAELNKTYCKVTKDNLKSKFHLMIHYPTMLEKFGPRTQYWTMQFEAKHRPSKISARAASNKLNICRTLALRNQMTLNNIFTKKNPLTFFT